MTHILTRGDIFDAVNDIKNEVHENAISKGFYDKQVDFGTMCSNLHGEVSELWEAYRRGTLDKQCDKPVTLTCVEEELADIIIRALDVAGYMKIDIGTAIETKMAYNATRPRMHGKIA